MKTKDDNYTSDMFCSRPVGRPRKANAMTVAERVRKHRAKKLISVTRNENCSRCGGKLSICCGTCNIAQR